MAGGHIQRRHSTVARAVPPTSRGHNPDLVACAQSGLKFSGHGLRPAIRAENDVRAAGSWTATLESVRRMPTSLRKNRYFSSGQKFDFPNKTIAPWMPSRASGFRANRILQHAEGIGILEGFDGRIQGIGHM